jgi:hypothetical protein
MRREIAETREEGYFIAGIGTGIKIVWTAFRFIPLPLCPLPLPLIMAFSLSGYICPTINFSGGTVTWASVAAVAEEEMRLKIAARTVIVA